MSTFAGEPPTVAGDLLTVSGVLPKLAGEPGIGRR